MPWMAGIFSSVVTKTSEGPNSRNRDVDHQILGEEEVAPQDRAQHICDPELVSNAMTGGKRQDELLLTKGGDQRTVGRLESTGLWKLTICVRSWEDAFVSAGIYQEIALSNGHCTADRSHYQPALAFPFRKLRRFARGSFLRGQEPPLHENAFQPQRL